jgi:hypothetical protein
LRILFVIEVKVGSRGKKMREKVETLYIQQVMLFKVVCIESKT